MHDHEAEPQARGTESKNASSYLTFATFLSDSLPLGAFNPSGKCFSAQEANFSLLSKVTPYWPRCHWAPHLRNVFAQKCLKGNIAQNWSSLFCLIRSKRQEVRPGKTHTEAQIFNTWIWPKFRGWRVVSKKKYQSRMFYYSKTWFGFAGCLPSVSGSCKLIWRTDCQAVHCLKSS